MRRILGLARVRAAWWQLAYCDDKSRIRCEPVRARRRLGKPAPVLGCAEPDVTIGLVRAVGSGTNESAKGHDAKRAWRLLVSNPDYVADWRAHGRLVAHDGPPFPLRRQTVADLGQRPAPAEVETAWQRQPEHKAPAARSRPRGRRGDPAKRAWTSDNWRVVFRFVDGEAVDVDLIDHR